ncbi:S41 family peptidase [Acinetobacter rongchengensis]|uniref:Tail specific protease domain-containing protein n=1 Tax=Acinetobacter rongchengensis TaxID=2419601 RepID=A0A3A8EYQ9_9GAMM|nr:S41 family peptidase [Acinetobacter rongchengensis]RKG39715.1 hypothetical protein D7V20_03680 [Acinetobacter rongchengensis]
MSYRLTHASYLLLMSSILLPQNVQAVEDTVPMTSAECLQDIDFTAQFLLENDAGIQAQKWTAYPESIQHVLNTQKEKAAQVQTVKQCQDIAKPFLQAIRKGHVSLSSRSMEDYVQTSSTPQEDDLVTTKKLSDSTTYIFIPSFGLSIKDQLEKIIKNNQDNLLNAPYLILDLRKNAGGQDSSAEPVYKLLGKAEYWSEIPQIYTSPTNIQAYKDLQKVMPDTETKKKLGEIINKMEHNKNDWVYIEGNTSLFVDKIKKKDVLANPKKVVVLTDEDCGSSGEEFVKTVRQNPRVVTMGRNTYGVLDASNLRDIKTPSTKLSLWYATSYVHRRAGQEIDNIGIPPSIKLPVPKDQQAYDDEVKFAQMYLEKNL